MLIIDNMDLPIPRKSSMYGDVMHAWSQALTVVENLVSGVAQSVNTGEALLGLSAWHIYPDICAIGEKTTVIEQRDHLVTRGGIVTLGLQRQRDKDPPGISWSMPLAHLRFYGGAVPSQRTVGLKSSKVSFDQIVLVAMGSVMTMWNDSKIDIDSAMRFLIAFAKIINLAHQHDKQQLLWPNVLADQARKVLSLDRLRRQEVTRLVNLGWRRYGVFLAPEIDHPPALFGLSDPNECIRLLRSPDQAIATMRDMADYIPVNLAGAITRYVHPDCQGFRMIEYASILPLARAGTTTGLHYRWLTTPDSWFNDDCVSKVLDRAAFIKSTLGELCGLLEPDELLKEIKNNMSGHTFSPRVIAKGSLKHLGF